MNAGSAPTVSLGEVGNEVITDMDLLWFAAFMMYLDYEIFEMKHGKDFNFSPDK